MKTKKVAFLGMFVAFAMVLSYVEAQIPTFIPIPGIKLGLPNIAIIVVLYKVGWKESIIINLVRVLLVSILFGTTLSLLYSVSGAVLSFGIMMILKKIKIFSPIFVSVAGGIFHNIGQIVVACFVTLTSELLYYLPVLLISGTISGILIGIISATVVKKLEKIEL